MNLIKRLTFNLMYLGSPPWDTGITPPEVLGYINNHPPGRALDLGCGTGTNAITLALQGWSVIGIDFVGSAIRAARRKAKKAGVLVDFHQDDVTRLAGIQPPFDFILDIGCFHNLPDKSKEAYSHKIPRLLSSEGTYLMYGFWQESDKPGSSGLKPQDLTRLQMDLELLDRKDGMERGMRPSSWFWFKRIDPEKND